MKSKIKELNGFTQQILTAINLCEVVNTDDLKALFPKNDISNNIRQLKYRGLVNTGMMDDIKYVEITEKGKKKVEKYGNAMERVYGFEDIPYLSSSHKKIRHQRHSKAMLAFIESGIKSNKYLTLQDGENEAVYIDGYTIKKELGEEVKGARVTGVLLTPTETFTVYSCENRGFAIISQTEKSYKQRLITHTPNTKERSYVKDIVVATSINVINNFLFNKKTLRENLRNYTADNSKKDQFLVPMENFEFQIKFLADGKMRNETLNKILLKSVNKNGTNVKEISNIRFTEYEKMQEPKSSEDEREGKMLIGNLLDLNLGMIKEAYGKMLDDNVKEMKLLILADYEDFFKELYTDKKIELVCISKDDINEIMEV